MGSPYTPVRAGANKYPFPSYADLGKECRDLFTKGYILGQFKINVKNHTCHGIEITTSGVHNHADKTAKADVQIKAAYPVILEGLSSSHKWDTDNLLKNEVILQDALYPGLKVSTEFRFDGEKAVMGGGAKIQQKHKYFTFDGVLDGSDDSNLITGGSLVTGYKGLIGAYKLDYDTNSGELKSNNLGAGYENKDYKFFLTLNKMSAFEGFFYHKVSREVEVGAMIKVGGGNEGGGGAGGAPAEGGGEAAAAGGGGGTGGGPMLAFAGRYMFGYGHALRAKINNQSMLGLGLEVKILPGWQAFASTEIDLKKFSEGNHKIGFGMDFGFD